MRFSFHTSLLVIAAFACSAAAQDATITVNRGKILTNNLSRYLTGACLEDVNHEVYGGIYSQMVFGESFQEPGASSRVEGFKAYGGNWTLESGVLVASGDAGPKLVSELPDFTDGEIGVKLMLTEGRGNAGLVVKLNKPGVGQDNFHGYEVSLDSDRQVLILGRHNNNWEPIREAACRVPVNQWIGLVVKMRGNGIEVLVDGKSVLTHQEDGLRRAGGFCLRPWEKTAKYKALSVRGNGKIASVAFRESANAFGPVSSMWDAVKRGSATGHASLDKTAPWVGTQSQKIEYTGGRGEIGVANMGLNRWGMCFVNGQDYEGLLRVRVDKPTTLYVALESADGSKTYAESGLSVKPGGWQKIPFKLVPNSDEQSGRFTIKLKQPGAASIGYAFLQPGEWGRYNGLPCRKDVVDGLVEQKLTVLRYGGFMINAAEYRWKKMIGPRDARPIYKGNWYPYSSNGWGIIDFLAMCDAAGFLAVPDFNVDETPQDMADFVQYANGPADSVWGRKRAEDGHPKPFGVSVIELGNEECVNEAYWSKFKPLAEAIWTADPKITIVVGDFAYGQPITDPYNFTGAPCIKTLAAHKKILDLATEHNREVWFDVHLGTDSPFTPHERRGASILTSALRQISPNAKFKVVVFELNAGSHGVRRMLGNACAINEIEQTGNDTPIVCSANCLQPDKQNDNGWDQGLLFLNPSTVWPQPPYYVTQMISESYLPQVIGCEVRSPENTLNVTAKQSEDGKTLQLQVVNIAAHPIKTRLSLTGFTPTSITARVAEVSGTLDDVNTPEYPSKIVPIRRQWAYQLSEGSATYTFPPYSFTIIRFR